MSATLQANCEGVAAERSASGHLSLQRSIEGDRCVVLAAGELDAASHDQLVLAATEGNHPEMVIDLTGVTFMDCSGYGSLAASRLAVERDGRELTLRGQTGQPGHLFELIEALEDRPRSRGVTGVSGTP